MTAPKAPWNRQPNPDPLFVEPSGVTWPDDVTWTGFDPGHPSGDRTVYVVRVTDRPRLRLIAEAVLFYAVVLFLVAGLLWLLVTWRAKP